MMSFILFSNGYVILPSAFHAEKMYRVFIFPEKSEFNKMYKITGATRKKKRGKGVRPAAIVIFETETGSCDHVFRLCVFVTVLIPLSAHSLTSSGELPIKNRL